MKTLVIFTTAYGNTEQIARALGDALKRKGTVEVLPIVEASREKLAGADLLLVGSPTQAFTMLPAMKDWLKSLPKGCLAGKRVAGFDTRVDILVVNNKFLTFMVNLFGYAAEKIHKALIKAGGNPAGQPAGFFIEEKEGPLREGETKRAAEWAVKLG